jgi:hypothetical protein
MKIIYFSSLLLLLLQQKAVAQFGDSLKIDVGTTLTGATEGYQPLWIVSNRYGTIADRNTDLSTHIRIGNEHIFLKSSENTSHSFFYINYALDLYNNNAFKDIFLKEAYLKAGFKNWEIRGGRYTEVIGETDPLLSSGSFGVSGNALPIPKVGIAVTRYTDVPFTKGWLQFKGQYVHGWLGKEQFVKNAFLHEKSFYLKLGKEKLSIYGGLTHFAEWGGKHPGGEVPGRFEDYLRIIRGSSGNANDPAYTSGPVDIANAVGNHIIVSDLGLTFKINDASFKLYTQTIFDKGKGDSSNTNKRDELVFLNIFGRDRMIGASWENNTVSWLQKVVVEGIFTKDQGGNIIYNGRYNYYNNGIYQTGWEYQGRVIGTPLFINRASSDNYNLSKNVNTIGGWNIVSNRVTGIHLGFKGNLSERLSYRTLATHVVHYGNYYNDAAFGTSKKQSHFLLESAYKLSPSFTISAAIGQDVGDLSENTGGLLKVEWHILK